MIQTRHISELTAAHAEGRVVLAKNASTEHESAEGWYDSYGAHISTDSHGDLAVQTVEYDWLDDTDDDAVALLVVASLSDPEDDEDVEVLQSAAESLVAMARRIRDAADTVESLLDDAVTAYEAGDVDALVEALRDASSEESDHGDDPATEQLIYSLCEIGPTTDEAACAATSLADLAAILDDAWYDAVEGCYTHLPTWGVETDAVNSLIGRSSAEGDIVSWDTTPADPMEHQYLMRTWHECHQMDQPEHVFEIRTHADLLTCGYDLR